MCVCVYIYICMYVYKYTLFEYIYYANSMKIIIKFS